jgi:3-methyladenine DNA glycosylase AlkD
MQDTGFIIEALEALREPGFAGKMAFFGIDSSQALGIRIPNIRALAKTIGRNQELSLALWEAGYHEAKLLATFIGDPRQVTEQQIDGWTNDFYSWDICDQACANLFIKTPFWKDKITAFTAAEPTFVKRAGFVLIAAAAVHLKKEPDSTFSAFFPLIEREAGDTRNFVKKAVNWALRQVGKRSAFLHPQAIATASNLLAKNNTKANWVALDALRELNSPAVLKRVYPQQITW